MRTGVLYDVLLTHGFMCGHKKRAGHTNSKARPILNAVVPVRLVFKF